MDRACETVLSQRRPDVESDDFFPRRLSALANRAPLQRGRRFFATQVGVILMLFHALSMRFEMISPLTASFPTSLQAPPLDASARALRTHR